jgi:hypothetical protein
MMELQMELEKGDFLVYLGEIDNKERGKMNHRGHICWVPLCVVEVTSTSSSLLLKEVKVMQQFSNVGKSPPRIGMYRSMSSGYLAESLVPPSVSMLHAPSSVTEFQYFSFNKVRNS